MYYKKQWMKSSGELNRTSANQEIPHILWNMKVHYHNSDESSLYSPILYP